MTAATPPARPRRERLFDLVPLALAALAEAAWVGVVYALLQAAVHEPESLGLAGLLVATLLGMWAVRWIAPRVGPRWPTVATALVCAVGVLGWLLAPGVLEAIAAGRILAAIELHPGGFLAGLAVLRGIAHRSAEGSELALNRLVTVGTPLLVVPLLLGGAISEPWRTDFFASAVIDIAVFLVAGMLGLALARSVSLGLSAGFDWRRNRVWLVALVASVIVVAAIALSGSTTVETAVRLLVTLTVVPLLLVGLIAGLPRISKRDVIVLLFVLLAVVVVATILSRLGIESPPSSGGGSGPVGGETDQGPTILAGILMVIGAVVLVLFLIGAWMRTSRRTPDSDVAEERVIDYGETELEPTTRRRWRRRRRAGPVDAPTAYLALLNDLERDEDLRRDPAETPAEHARRLRAERRGAVGLDLLAADYELARFAGVRLTAAENRRGIARWRRLRRAMRSTGI
jgi:MFS family permease